MSPLGLCSPPAIFFDRDGVLNLDNGYVYRKEDFIWVQGAKDALRLTASKHYLSIVITNQSGIARGYYSIADMQKLHEWIQSEVYKYGGCIDDIYYCPFHDEGIVGQYVISDHPDRKPNPGMILRAACDYNIDLRRSLMIGDKPTDIEAARRAGVESLLFSGGDLHETLLDWFARQNGS